MTSVHLSPPLEFSSPPSSPPTPGLLSFLPDLPMPKLGLTKDRPVLPRVKSPPPTSSGRSQYTPLSYPLSSTAAPSTSTSSSPRPRDVECGDCLPHPLLTGTSLTRSSVGRYARYLQLALRAPARNPLYLRDVVDLVTILLFMFNIFVWSRYFFA